MNLGRLLRGDTVTVATYTRDGAYGPVRAPALSVDCRVEADRKLVRTASGDEVLSETTLYLEPTLPLPDGTRVPTVEVFTPESLVTHDERQAQVVAVVSHRAHGPAVLIEVSTT